jgi:RNA polymerase sigma-70 factor (ECF subfamily)
LAKDKPIHEKELLLAVASGDQSAYRSLVDLYWKRVYGNTLALLKRPESAEEITQDIFLKIWQQRERLSTIENFAVYIYVIGRNQVLAALRKKIRELSLELPEQAADDAILPNDKLEMQELHRIILEGVDQLPAIRKKVFNMSRFEGLSYDEIAERLQISRNTVKDHIVNALNFLRNYISERAGKNLLLLIILHLL